MIQRLFLFGLLLLFVLASCNEQGTASDASNEEAQTLPDEFYLKEGKMIASTAFKTLSTSLKEKMMEGGVVEAVEYCNIAAYPLTDSLSREYDVSIRRVSDRLRNQGNRGSELENEWIGKYKALQAKGEPLMPFIHRDDEHVRFVAPIAVKPLCLSCHGQLEKHISTTDYQVITDLYPEDQAINYATGDLRGIWSIAFANNETE